MSATRRSARASSRTAPATWRRTAATIERELANGELLAIASTNALELGIDIGSLDAAVLTGYPGTRASMWQQAGRAGRRDADSLAILVAQDDPLDQYLVHHPEDLFDKPPEAAVIDPDEPVRAGAAPALRGAGAAAARRGRSAFFGDVRRRRSRGRAHDRARGAGAAQGHLARPRTGVAPPRGGHPGGRRTHLLHRDRRDRRAAGHRRRGPRVLHAAPRRRLPPPGRAVRGRRTRPGARVAVVHGADPDYYTQSRDITDIEVVDVGRARAGPATSTRSSARCA